MERNFLGLVEVEVSSDFAIKKGLSEEESKVFYGRTFRHSEVGGFAASAVDALRDVHIPAKWYGASLVIRMRQFLGLDLEAFRTPLSFEVQDGPGIRLFHVPHNQIALHFDSLDFCGDPNKLYGSEGSQSIPPQNYVAFLCVAQEHGIYGLLDKFGMTSRFDVSPRPSVAIKKFKKALSASSYYIIDSNREFISMSHKIRLEVNSKDSRLLAHCNFPDSPHVPELLSLSDAFDRLAEVYEKQGR